MTDFKNKYSFEQRKSESHRIINKYPDRIPLICQKSKTANKSCPAIDKQKYLVPQDITVGQFIYIIRQRLKLSSEKALYIFINGTIPSVGRLITDVYKEHTDEDGFLYIYYNFENTFG